MAGILYGERSKDTNNDFGSLKLSLMERLVLGAPMNALRMQSMRLGLLQKEKGNGIEHNLDNNESTSMTPAVSYLHLLHWCPASNLYVCEAFHVQHSTSTSLGLLA